MNWMFWMAIGACGLGAILLVVAVGWLLDRWASRPIETGGTHRVDDPLPTTRDTDWDATGSPRYAALSRLADAPTEVIRLPAIQEHTEEYPAFNNHVRPPRRPRADLPRDPDPMPMQVPIPEFEEPAPVEHVEVDEETGLDGLLHDEPSPELAEPTEAERKMADLHDEALWEDEYRESRRRHDAAVAGFHASATDGTIDDWLRGEERLPFLLEARRHAHEDVDDPSVEMAAAELAAIVAEAKAGAAR